MNTVCGAPLLTFQGHGEVPVALIVTHEKILGYIQRNESLYFNCYVFKCVRKAAGTVLRPMIFEPCCLGEDQKNDRYACSCVLCWAASSVSL